MTPHRRKIEPEEAITVPDIEDDSQIPDAVFTAKRLAKALDEINILNVKRDQDAKTISQLQDAVKKSTFTTATDEMNIKTWDKIAVPMLSTELRKLQSQGWHFIKARLEFVS